MKEAEEFQLPRGWERAKLGDICLSPQYGFTTKASEQGKTKFLRTTDITSGKINWETVPFCQTEPEEVQKYLLKKGDIVISRAGSVGFSYLVKTQTKAVFASYLIRFKPLIDENFMSYFLKSPSYWSQISEKSLGIAVQNVNATKLKEIPINLPPLAEQHRIVAKIEELFSELDNGVAQLRQVQAQLKSYRQSVLKHAFEGKLTEVWRQQYDQLPDARELLTAIQQERHTRHQQALKDWQQSVIQWAEAGKPGKKPTKPKAPKELPPLTEKEIAKLFALPEGWGWTRLGSAIEGIFDGPFGSNLKTADYVSQGVRVIRLENIGYLAFDSSKETFISEEKYQFLEKHTVRGGDIVFSSFIADSIRCVVLPHHIKKAINKADCFCIRNESGLVGQSYLSYLLSSRQIYNTLLLQVHGATRPRINTTQLKELPIPLCSTEEQHQIVQEIESRLSVAEHLEKTVEDSLRQAEVLRQSILQRAFTGQLVPQDPNDEPAAKLLKRIQQEKSESPKKSVRTKASNQTDEQLSITF